MERSRPSSSPLSSSLESMALRKTLANIYSQIRTIPTVSQANAPAAAVLRRRRILPQRCPFFEAAVPSDGWFPTGDRLIERIHAVNRDRILLDAISLPPPVGAGAEEVEKKLSVVDVKKVIRASQVAAVRERLRAISVNSVSYDEFLDICCKESGNQGMVIARALDDSGDVIVFGAVVFLRPELVVKAVESSISTHTTMKRREEEEELREMEEKKREIDEEAERKARRELWCGLGLVVAQTVGFMRLTFWELSWDVMEPICFFFTSLSFMAGYAFFLRTSKDPSFEGLFAARFAAKQRRLMRARGFDLDRFNELRGASPAAELSYSRKRRGFLRAGGSLPPN